MKCIWNTLKENWLDERDDGQSFHNKGKTITLLRARLLYAYCAGEVGKIVVPQCKACCILIHWCVISVHILNCQRHFTQHPRSLKKPPVQILTRPGCQAEMQHFVSHILILMWHFVWEGSQSNPTSQWLPTCSCFAVCNLICIKKNLRPLFIWFSVVYIWQIYIF